MSVSEDILTPAILETWRQRIADFRINPKRIHYVDAGDVVASGGFGQVRKAKYNPLPDRPINKGAARESSTKLPREILVAIKTLHIYGKIDSERLEKRFIREAVVWSRLKHPNVIEFLGFHFDSSGAKTEALFLCPWMNNGHSTSYLKQQGLSVVERLQLGLDVAKGLQYLHSHKPPICHGDIKGSNVLIKDDGHAALCDFGLSQVMDEEFEQLASQTVHRGTVRWTSPERLDDNGPLAPSSDVWSWGWLIWELVTEKIPFNHINNSSAVIFHIVTHKLPDFNKEPSITRIPSLIALIQQCWQREPTARFEMKECIEHLVHLMKELPESNASSSLTGAAPIDSPPQEDQPTSSVPKTFRSTDLALTASRSDLTEPTQVPFLSPALRTRALVNKPPAVSSGPIEFRAPIHGYPEERTLNTQIVSVNRASIPVHTGEGVPVAAFAPQDRPSITRSDTVSTQTAVGSVDGDPRDREIESLKRTVCQLEQAYASQNQRLDSAMDSIQRLSRLLVERSSSAQATPSYPPTVQTPLAAAATTPLVRHGRSIDPALMSQMQQAARNPYSYGPEQAYTSPQSQNLNNAQRSSSAQATPSYPPTAQTPVDLASSATTPLVRYGRSITPVLMPQMQQAVRGPYSYGQEQAHALPQNQSLYYAGRSSSVQVTPNFPLMDQTLSVPEASVAQIQPQTPVASVLVPQLQHSRQISHSSGQPYRVPSSMVGYKGPDSSILGLDDPEDFVGDGDGDDDDDDEDDAFSPVQSTSPTPPVPKQRPERLLRRDRSIQQASVPQAVTKRSRRRIKQTARKATMKRAAEPSEVAEESQPRKKARLEGSATSGPIRFQAHDIEFSPESGLQKTRQARRGVILTTGANVAVKPVDFSPPSEKASGKRSASSKVAPDLQQWALANHQNIVKFLGTAFIDGSYSIVMDFCDGGNMATYLAQNENSDQIRKDLLRQTAAGLAYLHTVKEGPVIHSNLKPSNILVDGIGHVKLSDVGILNISTRLTGESAVHGKPGDTRWTAPEILEGESLQLTSDVYSFGCVAIFILRNYYPYADLKTDAAIAKAIYEGHPPISGEKASVIHSDWNLCWARDPLSRPTMPIVLASVNEW